MLIGFVIASHEADGKLARLIDALNHLYGHPPIAVHHDFGQAVLDRSAFGSNIRFVEPHSPTGWGKWGTVDGMLRALGLLYSFSDPDWFFFLSAADYPCRPGEEVRAELVASSWDALVDLRPLDPAAAAAATLVGDLNPKLTHFDNPENLRLKWRFYKGRQYWFPIIRTRPRLRVGKYTLRPHVETRSHPFDDGFPCFYGDFWYGGNRRVADILMHPKPRHLALQRHYKDRPQVDESYVQTVLANEEGIVICRDNRRFAEWNGGGASPMNLEPDQLDGIFSSGAYFARKFPDGSHVTNRIDRHLAHQDD